MTIICNQFNCQAVWIILIKMIHEVLSNDIKSGTMLNFLISDTMNGNSIIWNLDWRLHKRMEQAIW